MLSALLIVAAFLVNRNIFNSDNYRYLIYLLTPWSLGFGLLMSGLIETRAVRPRGSVILVVMLICGMTAIDVRLVSRQAWLLGRPMASVFVSRNCRGRESASHRQSTVSTDLVRAFALRGSVGRDTCLRRLLGRVSDVFPLREEGRRHSLSDVSQSVPGLVARSWARIKESCWRSECGSESGSRHRGSDRRPMSAARRSWTTRIANQLAIAVRHGLAK